MANAAFRPEAARKNVLRGKFYDRFFAQRKLLNVGLNSVVYRRKINRVTPVPDCTGENFLNALIYFLADLTWPDVFRGRRAAR